MASRIMHGRREGQTREMGGTNISVIPEGVDPREVTVLQPEAWRRIQNSLSHYNEEQMRLQAKRQEREELHALSKESVKHWENTIEGQRLKKLQARKLREEKEEEERVKIDIEEAKHQAQKRKEAIERAKTLQYYQTDRVKTFHGALLLTEVLKERDAQIEMKNGKLDAEKIREAHLLRLQQRQREEAIMEDQKRALRRYNERKAVADFQNLQILDHIEESKKAKQLDTEEGENIKQQVDMYMAAKQAIEEQRRKDKKEIMEEHQRQLADREARHQIEQKKIEEEEEEIRQFGQAKKKMAKMRKEKETELFRAFQDHTERMRKKLANQKQQQVDDEDDRIAKAVAERESKREAEERQKYESDMKTKKEIHDHRIYMMKENERQAMEEAKKDREILRNRVESDKLYHLKQEEKRVEQLGECKKLKEFQTQQIGELKDRAQQARAAELDLDNRNGALLKEEEVQFQEYASKVIAEAKAHDRNPYPLIKAAREGPGGGRGPKFDGKKGLRPSYLVCDGTGVQLPNYSDETVQGSHTKIYGNPGHSRKRLGFTW
ncbi:coiled-coil domain-containing protein 173-like [Orbicella faveolata]|uniref:coiled-coil domain-containing protein 173-like n=2 Tax=Orbicella faveolata TaxID=48498 RepID=UPI0009E3CB9E|nr:coiled-coil domain-containing protein 173-like [Orbicella faveolata]